MVTQPSEMCSDQIIEVGLTCFGTQGIGEVNGCDAMSPQLLQESGMRFAAAIALDSDLIPEGKDHNHRGGSARADFVRKMGQHAD
jgi:hypothetical protein